jgi:hypothetical protein
MIYIRDDHFQFGSVFIKQNNQTKNLKKKPKPVQTDRFRFGSAWFFRTKTGSNWFGSIFLVFSGLSQFFRFWLSFSWFFLF